MSDDDAMVEEFFSELNDKYYPQVLEGLELLDGGEVAQGVEVLARPLHTIKGVSGFMSGFEAASKFTHKVEDYLKKIQSGDVDSGEENVGLLTKGVNMIFQVLEQIRETGTPDKEETEALLKEILERSAGKVKAKAETSECLEVELRDGVIVLRILAPRIHLEPERKKISTVLEEAKAGKRVLIDMSKTKTFNSAAWEDVAAYAEKCDISVFGMAYTCKDVFYSWGFDREIAAYAEEENFWKTITPTQVEQ